LRPDLRVDEIIMYFMHILFIKSEC